jgi:hypothetical protein
MTEKQIIKRLILYNMQKDWDDRDDRCFSLNWHHTKLTYNIEKNKDKSLVEMVDWFYDKIIKLSKHDD